MQQDFLQLRAAIAVAKHGSFRAAAKALDISPTALGRAVASLEERMRVKLFHRTTRTVSLTPAGHLFIARVEPAIGEISIAIETASAFTETPAGTLRINAAEGAARQIVAPLILEFLRRYPEMSVDLTADGELSDIVASGFDAGVRFAEAVPKEMVAVPLEKEHSMAVVASPEYLSGRVPPESPGDLLQHECIRTRHPSGVLYRWEFSKNGQELRVDVRGRLTANNYNVAIDAALAGGGIAYTSEYFVREHVRAGRLIRHLTDWTPPFDGLHLYYPKHRHIQAGLRAFVSLIRERFRESASSSR
jgi:DNA-binding transcriptional LysR family regulator